ncbi:hypothetical protein FGG08_003973 [Glutinoglossum americanum]|uniref:Uncharacterized protein n=1 Tax=Glutinoglossum americanum TaxID=1670608 RepID=A0A9P8IA24_9PEZI|nr:hypothetical protein FGG08_003973 [Glutinoglossum americanum]
MLITLHTVAPKLRFGPYEDKMMYGRVTTKYASPNYVSEQCQTPMRTDDASEKHENGITCLNIVHAGQAYYSLAHYLETWTAISNAGGDSPTDLKQRPVPVGMLYDNTTVTGSWIDIRNVTDESHKAGRIVNNVTLAMPHAGIFDAARDPRNDIMQPEGLEGLGEYTIYASLPSPSVNVLCASLNAAELGPFIATNWHNSTSNVTDIPFYPDPLNKTTVDEIFGFGKRYGSQNVTRVPPIFPKLPADFNTVLNDTGWYADSIYLVGRSNSRDAPRPYVLCSLRSSLYPNCSTRYNVTFSGSMLSAHCDDDSDPQRYIRHHPEAPYGWVEPDWKNIASTWSETVALKAGDVNANASTARLLTQLILNSDNLDSALPSFAEALAALAGSTLLMSARGAPFIHNWTYGVGELSIPQYQSFNTSMRRQLYQSGSLQSWQGIFYVVLALVFLTNIFCLISLLATSGQVTDFTELQNLFSLSINSPPSRRLAGSCGGGPEKNHLMVKWYVNMQGEHVFLENVEEEEDPGSGLGGEQMEEESPIVARYSALSKRGSGYFWDRA